MSADTKHCTRLIQSVKNVDGQRKFSPHSAGITPLARHKPLAQWESQGYIDADLVDSVLGERDTNHIKYNSLQTKASISRTWNVERAKTYMQGIDKINGFNPTDARAVISLFVPQHLEPVGFLFFAIHHSARDHFLSINLSLAWTHPSMRRQGLGRHLVAHLFQYINDFKTKNSIRFSGQTAIYIYADYLSYGGKRIAEHVIGAMEVAKDMTEFGDNAWPLLVSSVTAECGW